MEIISFVISSFLLLIIFINNILASETNVRKRSESSYFVYIRTAQKYIALA